MPANRHGNVSDVVAFLPLDELDNGFPLDRNIHRASNIAYRDGFNSPIDDIDTEHPLPRLLHAEMRARDS